ncbi:MAG: GNAT family N-acetyltransferase [Acidimicrobiia bacterium]
MPNFRPLDRSDTSSVHALVRRCELADDIPIVTPVEEIEEMFDEPHFQPALDGWVIEVDDAIIGWGRIYHTPSGVGQERAYLLGDIDPRWRGQGIGRALLARQIDRARAVLASYEHALPGFIRTHAYDWRQDALGLYEAASMAAVRYSDELIRPLDVVPPRPSGAEFTIHRWNEAHADPARLVMNAAFADHWGSTPRDSEAWQTHLTSYGTRLDLSFVAFAGDEMIGGTTNFHVPEDEEVTDRRDGWIGMLGVLRPWRKRGVASALIIESLHAFAEAGFTHAMLGVDSANPSGAYTLYTGLGFRPLHRSVTYELPM